MHEKELSEVLKMQDRLGELIMSLSSAEDETELKKIEQEARKECKKSREIRARIKSYLH